MKTKRTKAHQRALNDLRFALQRVDGLNNVVRALRAVEKTVKEEHQRAMDLLKGKNKIIVDAGERVTHLERRLARAMKAITALDARQQDGRKAARALIDVVFNITDYPQVFDHVTGNMKEAP
jgi:ABC-type transporter Mla subunit MlaD